MHKQMHTKELAVTVFATHDMKACTSLHVEYQTLHYGIITDFRLEKLRSHHRLYY